MAVFPYLLWRRQWAAAASMVVFLGIFSVRGSGSGARLPAQCFGIEDLGSGNGRDQLRAGFRAAREQNWSWVNQSIIAVTHRLTRPVNYNQDDPAKPPRYMNLLDLDFKTANWVVLAISLAIGLGYVAVMPPRDRG